MSSLFSKIIQGSIPCEKILENEDFIAFLDIRPIQPGHTLVVPKQEIDELFDLPELLLSKSLVFAKHIAAALKKAFPCNRVGVLVAGLEVPHAHIHLVPIQGEGDLSFSHAKPATPEELVGAGARIRTFLGQ
jgi:histidine triad (HIT) family protein